MLCFNFKKISRVPPAFFRKRPEISNYLKKLKEVLKEKNHNLPESFLTLPEEKTIFPVKSFKKPKLIIVVGIGGSILGTEAIYRALENKKNLTEALFFDNVNPLFLRKSLFRIREISPKKGEISLFLVSKGGKTLETISNFSILFKALKKYKPKIFVITDEKSVLCDFAQDKNFQSFFIPKYVGGRYSVLSGVGILPLASAGVNTRELLSGAREANKVCLKDEPLKNPAFSSSLIIFYYWRKGKNIYSNFVFPSELESLGKWHQQLMAESLGKKGKGITPTVAMGTCDFHSLGQLYLEGPEDKLINFVFIKNLGPDFRIENIGPFAKIFPGLENKKAWNLNRAIFEGAKKAYLKKKIPFTETILNDLDERNLGMLLQEKMIETILLAKLMKVYAFDQPAVELYKKEAQKILKGNPG